MALDYCNSCAAKRALLPGYDPGLTNLTGSAVQLQKYLEHTVTGRRTGQIVSVFSDPSYDSYKGLFLSTVHSGSYHCDDRGRESLVLVMGKDCGFSWDDRNKAIRYSEDAVRVVCYRDETKVHQYSQNSTAFTPARCLDCGNIVL